MAGTGYSGGGYQSSFGGLTLDPTINDGDTSTGPSVSSGMGPVITGAIDLGSALALTGVVYTVYYENSLAKTLEYGTDAVTWTVLSTGGAPSHLGVGSLWTDIVTANFTARYLRLSVRDPMPAMISIREMAPSGSSAYFEDLLVKAGLKGTETETAAVLESPTAKAGARPSVTDSFGHGGGGTDYAEPNLLVKAGAKPSGSDGATEFESPTVKSGSLPSGTDVQRNNAVAAHFYDAPIGFSGPKPSGTSNFFANDAPQARAGSKPRGLDGSAVSEVVTVKSGAAAPSGSAQGYMDVLLVKAAGLPSGVDTLVASDVSTLKSGGKPSAADNQSVHDAGMVASGVKPSGSDGAASSESITAKSGVNVAQSAGVFASLDVGTLKSGVVASGTDIRAAVEAGLVKAGSKPLASTSETRGYVDIVMVSAGSRPYGTDVAASQE